MLAIWRMRALTISGKITVIKSLAISKMFITYLSNVSDAILDMLDKIQEKFLWNGKPAKIKHKALIASYRLGGAK